MTSDIPLCQGAVNRVCDGMHRDIRIGMTHKGLIMRDFHTAQNDMIARSKAVNVIAIAQSNFHHHLRLSSRWVYALSGRCAITPVGLIKK